MNLIHLLALFSIYSIANIERIVSRVLVLSIQYKYRHNNGTSLLVTTVCNYVKTILRWIKLYQQTMCALGRPVLAKVAVKNCK